MNTLPQELQRHIALVLQASIAMYCFNSGQNVFGRKQRDRGGLGYPKEHVLTRLRINPIDRGVEMPTKLIK